MAEWAGGRHLGGRGRGVKRQGGAGGGDPNRIERRASGQDHEQPGAKGKRR